MSWLGNIGKGILGALPGGKEILGAKSASKAAKGSSVALKRGLQGALTQQKNLYDYTGNTIKKTDSRNQSDISSVRDKNIKSVSALNSINSKRFKDAYASQDVLDKKEYLKYEEITKSAFGKNKKRQTEATNKVNSRLKSSYNSRDNILSNTTNDTIRRTGQTYKDKEASLKKGVDYAMRRSQRSFDYASQNLMPYITVGNDAFQQYAEKAKAGFNFQYENSPDYKYIREQALTASINNNASRGMGLSGAAQKALSDRASNLAASDYGNQYNRALTTYNTDMSGLQSVANIGINASQELRNREQTLAGTQSNLQMGLSSALSQATSERDNQINAYKNEVAKLVSQGRLDEANQLNDILQKHTQALASGDINQANASINNLNRYTTNVKNTALNKATSLSTLSASAVDETNRQRSGALADINNQRATTANANIQNNQNYRNYQSNYNIENSNINANRKNALAVASNDLWGGIGTLGMSAAMAAVGGGGGLGGAGGMTGALQGMQLGGQIANMGAGQNLTPSSQSSLTGNGSYGYSKPWKNPDNNQTYY